ncbi:class I SAM-dependent methyltransferase [Desulfoscipio gibsoniae]|uniref:Methyltransferase family protein n=1 Tax=Desulfoscipio gibsoniae DSM 7213 TaxID=767817 RepID=R4KE08_9FIRM|nr:class I SAM-dependent methyltransferase [Desulfoscipio gibsoniae]AGL01408.1 methyltransferase family protein [Desulfoscipio gibsoniae DSM 7213]
MGKVSDLQPFIWGLTEGHRKIINKLVENNNIKCALDVACGYGETAIMLASLGVEVVSLGTDPRIVERAKHRAVEAGHNPTFLLGDMRDVSTYYAKRCDLITCMGNSLSYLTNTDDIWGTLAQFYTLLLPGGMLVIHTLNYDLIWEREKKFSLPEFMGSGMTVMAQLQGNPGHGDTKIVFSVVTVQKGKVTQTFEYPIKPLFCRDLNMLLAEMGFQKIKNYNPDGRKNGNECLHNITLAYRPGGRENNVG